MVTEQARWILRNTKVDPLKVAKAFHCTEEECFDYISDYHRALNAAVESRDYGFIRNQAERWSHSLDEAWETKRLILLERLKNAKTPEEKQGRLTAYKVFTNKINRFSLEEIEKARNYPIENMIQAKRNMAKCPFHPDKTASLNIKNNFFYCHGCGETGDSIDFAMKLYGISFKEAIIKLT